MKGLYIIKKIKSRGFVNEKTNVCEIMTDPFVVGKDVCVILRQVSTAKVFQYNTILIDRVYNSLKQAQQHILQEKKDG